MGAVRAGNFKTVGQSNAQVIDGSLKFDGGKSQYLKRTPSSTGNRKTWTWSFWTKRSIFGETEAFFGAYTDSNNRFYPNFNSDNKLNSFGLTGGVTKISVQSNAVFRDTSWYHIVIVLDTTESSSSNKLKYYVNGSLQQTTVSTTPADDIYFNLTSVEHRIGDLDGSVFYDGYMSNVYFIDGQALDPSYFGYTDPLTNTWRPKKYVRTTTITGDTGSAVGFGTNGFWLPLDGNTPIGKDMSGKGNDWTPVNFGGSNTLEKATGALPILNTDGGGKVGRVGVRTDSNASSLVLALPLVGIKSDFSNAINSGTSNKAITANGNAAASSAQSNFYGGSFTFDGTGDTLSVPSSSDFQIWSGAFTVECWFYLNSLVDSRGIFGVGNRASTTTRCFLITRSSGNLQFDWDGWSADGSLSVSAGLSAGRWYHCAVVSNGSTVSIYVNGVSLGSASIGSSSQANAPLSIGANGAASNPATNDGINGYIQDFRIYKGVAKYTQNFIPASTDPDILPDTPSGVAYSSNVALVPSTDGAVAFDGSGDYLSLASNADFAFGTGDFTVEFWYYHISGNDRGLFANNSGASVGVNFLVGATANNLFRIYNGTDAYNLYDFSVSPVANTWQHLAVVRNSGTLTLYVNGVASGSTSWSGVNAGNTATFSVGSAYGDGRYAYGFISNFHVVKGTALYTANFTPPTGPISSVANTKLLCCKSNSSATVYDVSPGTITANGNAAASNFNPFTVNINTQRGQESGYCTLNPLKKGSLISLSDGNLKWSSSGSGYGQVHGTIGMSSGKWYWECMNLTGGLSSYGAGVVLESASSLESEPGGDANSWAWLFRPSGGNSKYNNGNITTYGNQSVSTSDVVGVAFNADTGDLTFYVNGVSQGTAFTLTTGRTYLPLAGDPNSSTNTEGNINFGQKPFKFPPPAGFQPLALANTPRPTIVRPDQYVGIVTYTGNGSTRDVIVGWKPDLVWIKARNTVNTLNRPHQLFDTVRGAPKALSSNRTDAEDASGGYDNDGALTAFTSNGFTVENGPAVGNNGSPYVAWCWKAGGNSNTFNIDDVGYATASAAGLTAGTITPTGASVNTKSGFSIITYTGNNTAGATISHGLNNIPKFIITMKRGGGREHAVWHGSLATSGTLYLANTYASGTYPNRFDVTGFTNSVFKIGSDPNTVNEVDNYVAYLWSEIPGFSKFGSYTANNSSNGVHIECGFKPALVIIKTNNASSSWAICDSKRATAIGGNPVDKFLFAESSNGEGADAIDFLSNGFKLRSASGDLNYTGRTYIYAAFAESPSFNLYGAQANAR